MQIFETFGDIKNLRSLISWMEVSDSIDRPTRPT